jgi:hypothetical protein
MLSWNQAEQVDPVSHRAKLTIHEKQMFVNISTHSFTSTTCAPAAPFGPLSITAERATFAIYPIFPFSTRMVAPLATPSLH